MKVLLTGGTGMVGRNVLEAAASGGIAIDAPRRSELDLLHYEQVLAYLRRTRPDVVVHAAGKVGGIQANIADPLSFFVDNLDMGRNIVLAAFHAGVPRLINLSSSCVYPRAAPNPLREESLLSGELEPTNEGYALAKVATMRICQYVAAKNPAFRYRSLVPCNLYGPHDTFDPGRSHLVASVLHKLHEAVASGKHVVDIWGSGTARREFLYVGDLAQCILRAIQRYDALPAVMNVGVGTDHTIDEYYRIAAEIIGYRGTFEHDLAQPEGMRQKLVDVSRLRAWGWRPPTTLRDGIAMTYEHYQQRVQSVR